MRVTVKARGVQRERVFPLGTTPKTIADWKARERHRLRDEHPPASKGTIAKDIDTYLDSLADRPALKKERTYQLAWWAPRIGHLKRSSLTAVVIRTALAELRTTREASTCNHYRDALAALWTTLEGKDGRNPLRNVPKFTEPESEPRHLPRTLIARILDTMPDRGLTRKGQARGTVSFAKLRLRVIWQTGFSPAEIMRIRRSDLFLDEAAVYVQRREKGQGVEGIKMPLTADGVEAIRALADAGALGPFSTPAVYKSFRLACDRLLEHDAEQADHAKDFTAYGRRLLAQARPYDLRHTFGTFVFRETGDLSTTKELMRHRSSKTTKRYARGAIPAHLKSAVDRLPQKTIQPTASQPKAS